MTRAAGDEKKQKVEIRQAETGGPRAEARVWVIAFINTSLSTGWNGWQRG
jgi:hypothetical protein